MSGTAGMRALTLDVWTRMQLDYRGDEQVMARTHAEEFRGIRTDKGR